MMKAAGDTVTQLEDCVDYLKVVHSRGPSKKRRGGLDVGQMNSSIGGSQPTMRNSMIRLYLGPFDSILSGGMEQSMSFLPTDIGP